MQSCMRLSWVTWRISGEINIVKLFFCVSSYYYIRFVTVTDRFLAELGPVASGQVPKDLDMKYEHLVQGLKHIKIKVAFTYQIFIPNL